MTGFDIVIIGSGAGGGTMARALASSGARILIVERGDRVPQEPENWSPQAVWRDNRYRPRESWTDGRGESFAPYTHYNVGGNTKFWGSVLYRFRQRDFDVVEHLDGISPAWPIDYATLAPYYDAAERMYHVHGQHGVDPTDPPRGAFPHPSVPHAPRMAHLVRRLEQLGYHPSALPLGLIRPGEPGGCQLCDTCNSFPCRIHAKSDAETCAVQQALAHANVELWTGATATRLVADGPGRRVMAVEIERDGVPEHVAADLVIVSAGAANSAALLLRSRDGSSSRTGLANSSGLVGRRYMAHLATMMQGFWPMIVNDTVFQKTVAINDFYFGGARSTVPLGHVQSQGRTHPVMAKVVGDSRRHFGLPMHWIPLEAYELWMSQGVDWLAMSEDLPHEDNRVTLDTSGQIVLDYRPNNVNAHQQLVKACRTMLGELGAVRVVAHSAGVRNTTHQCGTLVFGRDPETSVLDPYCRSHDVTNLFVVDASFFPSSAAVNPGLTIIAQALRVADHIRQRAGLDPAVAESTDDASLSALSSTQPVGRS